MKIGDKVTGRISGLKPYGAFVTLEDGSVGLIHISEIKTGFVDNIHLALSLNQEVLAQIIEIDEFTGKISLSLRTLEEERHRLPRKHRFSSDRHKTGFLPLRRALPDWTTEALTFLKEQRIEQENTGAN